MRGPRWIAPVIASVVASAMAPVLVAGALQDGGAADCVEVSAPVAEEALRVERGAGEPALVFQESEELHYVVEVDIGPFRGLSAGSMRFRSWVVESVDGTVGHIDTVFVGSHLGYEHYQRIHALHDPFGTPALETSDTQRGSRSHRRELRILDRDGTWTLVYRWDGHCKGCKDKGHYVRGFLGLGRRKHCKDCKEGEHRVWRAPRERVIPRNALDFLSCIYLIRTLISSGADMIEAPLLEKDRLWALKMTAGERKRIETPLGGFQCRRILFQAQKPAGEEDDAKFTGLFGMDGSMKFWVDEATGILVQISGKLPLGPLDLGVKIGLVRAKGAPAELKPLAR